jgi:hypothetical protein
MTYKGVVKGNLVILEEGARLPNGATVVVTVQQAVPDERVSLDEIAQRQALIAQIKEFGQKLAGRNINLGDLILEGREELESRA